MYNETIDRLVDTYQGERGGLIAILEAIQAKYSYLPEEALRIVADKTGASLVDVYGVATFYKAFSLAPRGKHLVSCCLGTACHVRGGPSVAEEFQRRLGVKPGETTEDREFTLETVACLGACALGPIVVVDGHYFSKVRTADVPRILEQTKAGLDAAETEADERVFPVEVSCPRCNRSLMDPGHPMDERPSIRVVYSFGRKHGSMHLSSMYGSYNLESDHDVPMDTVLDFFCPHCHAELATAVSPCPKCAAPMVPMIVRGGGFVQICSRRGCKEHRLDLDGVNL